MRIKGFKFSLLSPMMGAHFGRNPVSGQRFGFIAPLPFVGVDLEFPPYGGNEQARRDLEERRDKGMLDHVTFEVADSAELHSDEMRDFFVDLGMYEVDASGDVLEEGWDVRWFKAHRNPTILHLCVADPDAIESIQRRVLGLGLTHFCMNVGVHRFNRLRKTSDYIEHDSGRGLDSPLCRFWLKGPCGIRVEVRP